MSEDYCSIDKKKTILLMFAKILSLNSQPFGCLLVEKTIE